MEIKIDASDLLNQLDMLDERARKVDDLTVRDMKRRVPGMTGSPVNWAASSRSALTLGW